MVLNSTELESDLFWKWFSRPRQTDGTTVEDYYALFCHWKEEMISLSFPAKEEDCTDGFMDNLLWEIRFRLSGYISSMSRPIDVYYAAKFVESMLVIEETLKKIKATLDTDPNEPQMHDSNKSTEAIVQLEDDSQTFVMSNGVRCKLELTTNTSAGLNLSGLNLFSGNYHFNSRIVEENSRQIKAHKVFDEMSHPENGGNDQPQGAEDVGDEHSDEILVQIEEDFGNDISPFTNYKVLDELLQTVFTMTTTNVWIDDGSAADYGLNSHTGAPFIRVLGCSVHEALMLNKSIEPNFAGLNHFSGNIYSYPMIKEVDLSLHKVELPLNEKVQQLYSFKLEVTDVSYHVFNKMTNPGHTFLHSFSPVPLFGNDLSSIKLDKLHVYYKLNHMWLNVLLMLIFDPGGCSRLHMDCGSFKCFNKQGDYCWAQNMAEHLIISDLRITYQEACNEWSDPNVQVVKTFIPAAPMTSPVNGSTYGSTMTWFEKVTPILKDALGKNVMEDNAHEVFDKWSKTHFDRILLIVYDPGGRLPLQLDGDVLKFDNRFQHLIDLQYAVGVISDVPNFRMDWDYAMYNAEIISKVIEDKYSQVQNIFTKTLMSLDIELVQVTFFIVSTMTQPGIVPRIVKVSSDYVIKAVVIYFLVIMGVRTSGHLFMVADTIELLASETYNMAIMGNKLSKLSSLCVKSSIGKTFNQSTLYQSCQQVQDSIQPAQPLIKKLQQLNEPVIKCSYDIQV